MNGRLLWIVTLAVLFVASPSNAQPVVAQAVEPPAMTPWLPAESYPEGKQYDARLDQSVRFWGASIALKDVFASIKDQTGVEIGFWPLGDMNERVCVNLYLNPEKPPSLRDLMVQLSWVTDCGFAWTKSDLDSTYCLLSTSIKDSIREELLKEQQELRQKRLEHQERQESENRRQTEAKLEACLPALSLSRDDLIRRYRGVDDYLLLAMLEPNRRLAVDLALDVAEDDWGKVMGYRMIRRDLKSFSQEQQARIKAALEEDEEGWDSEQREQLESGAFDWDQQPVEVVIGVGDDGVAFAAVPAGAELVNGPVFGALFAQLLDTGQAWLPKNTIALRQALGEVVTEEERERLNEEFDQFQEMRFQRGITKDAISHQPETLGQLSPTTEADLNAIAMPQFAEGSYPLWHMQESVGKASGRHIISDCFYQPSLNLAARSELLNPEETGEMTALRALQLSCAAMDERYTLLFNREEGFKSVLAWEWGEAGPFLRFRSTSRAVWRASMWPEEVLDLINQWIEPAISNSCGSGNSTQRIELNLDLREIVRVFPFIDGEDKRHGSFQLRLGGLVSYGDLTDQKEACFQAARAAVCQALTQGRWGYRVFVGFTEQQWQQVRAEGLRWNHDLSPSQQSEMLSETTGRNISQGKLANLVIRLEEMETNYRLIFTSGGSRVFGGILPKAVYVSLVNPRGQAEVEIPTTP